MRQSNKSTLIRLRLICFAIYNVSFISATDAQGNVASKPSIVDKKSHQECLAELKEVSGGWLPGHFSLIAARARISGMTFSEWEKYEVAIVADGKDPDEMACTWRDRIRILERKVHEQELTGHFRAAPAIDPSHEVPKKPGKNSVVCTPPPC